MRTVASHVPTVTIPVDESVNNRRFAQTTRLRVCCGCKEIFESIFDGQAHAAATGHTLHIHGEIRAEK